MELKPDWVAGFTDGEGCFFVGLNPHPEMTAGYQVLPEFRIVQHQRDLQVLHALKRFFKAGVVRVNHGDRWELRIRKFSSLQAVVAFFASFPLKTRKQLDYLAFASVIRMMERREHLTPDGIAAIRKLAGTMNRGRAASDDDSRDAG